MQHSRPGGTPGPRSPVALPFRGKSSIREGGESLVWGPAWLEIKTVKFFEPGLAITVGHRLEDEAFKALPKLLKKDYGLVVKGRLKRKFVQDNQGQEIEVNILGEGEREGEVYIIVGESKSQLSKRDVDDFIRRKLKRLEGVFPRMFPVLVTYMISQPGVEEYAQEKGIALYYSYDF